MAQRKKWDPERMKSAIEAMRNKEMGSYKVSRVFNVSYHKQHYRVILKTGRKAEIKQSKQKWAGSKFSLVKQKMIWLSTVLCWKETFLARQ
jgi:hypothetical protein